MLIDSIKIIHHELHGGEYRLLADFFRLIGSYVGECRLRDGEKKTDFDVVIIIDNHLPDGKLEELKNRYPNHVILDGLDFEASNLNAVKKQYLHSCLDKIAGQIEKPSVVEDLKKVADVYVEKEIMQSRCSALYLNTEVDIVKKAQENFAWAYEQIFKLAKDNDLKYLQYAKINLASMLNELSVFLNERKIFNTRKLIEAGNELLQTEKFSNVYILQGMIAEMDAFYSTEAGDYYEMAIDSIAGKSYANYVYYRLGRYFEKIAGDEEQALANYELSVEANRYDYRSTYKLAMWHRNKGDNTRAEKYFNKIRVILRSSATENYLQQREYEYLYKVNYNLAQIYEEQKYYDKALEAYQDVIRIVKQISEENRLYDEIFDGEAERYKECLKKKLLLDPVLKKILLLNDIKARETEKSGA